MIWILPFVYLIIQSFAETYETSLIIPAEWTLDNYRALFDKNLHMTIGGKDTVVADIYPFWRWYLNTLVIAIICSILFFIEDPFQYNRILQNFAFIITYK